MISAETIGSGPRVGWFLHGILGRGRNWRSFAANLGRTRPDWRFVLPDLRCHGDSPPAAPPHDLAACASDLEALAEQWGAPELVVGHSFGGKVALAWLNHRAHLGAEGGAAPLDIPRQGHAPGPRVTWVLDSPPGRDRPATDPTADPLSILRVLRSLPSPAPSRDALRAGLRAAKVSEPLVAWLLTSTAEVEGGWRFVYDLDGVEALLADYFQRDLWPVVEGATSEVHFVRAGRSDRWSAEELARASQSRADWHVLPDAGHWLHVDDPAGVAALLAPSLA